MPGARKGQVGRRWTDLLTGPGQLNHQVRRPCTCFHERRLRMRRLALFVLILAAAPARTQGGEAEKLYRAMEKKVVAAESLALRFNSEMTEGDKKFTVKGTIYIAAGN